MLDACIGAVSIIVPVLNVLIVRPLRAIGNLFFRFVLVNIYRIYFSFKKNIVNQQPKNISKKWIAIVNNRHSIHVAIVVIALVTMFTSITSTHAENYVEKTLVASLITQEFSDQELIIETANETENNSGSVNPVRYTQAGYVKRTPTALRALSEEEILQESVASSISQGGSVLIKQNVATTDIERRERTEQTIYTVEPGDTVTSIARKFEISIDTILWENNLTAYSIIRPGKELIILPSTGLTHTVKQKETVTKLAETYQVEVESILESNKLLADSSLTVGQNLFIPNGLKPTPTPSVRYIEPPSVRNFASSPRSGAYVWPSSSYTITQYYTYRHFGLDIGARNGSPIYAAADGEVIESNQGRWNGGYGTQVVIDHGGGVRTRYAHNSYNLVDVGQKVTQGQPIAAVGSTGRSSGPHVHFEIITNGRRINPLNYLSR